MSGKLDELKETYRKDADQMASKARFGYFSLKPSHTAAVTDFDPKPRRWLVMQTPEMKMAELPLNPGTSTQGRV